MNGVGILNSNSQMKAYGRDLRNPSVTLPIRVRLVLSLKAAENKRKMAIQFDNGDMWARAWELWKECKDALSVLDDIDNGTIKPLWRAT